MMVCVRSAAPHRRSILESPLQSIPYFESGFSYGLGAWAHQSCFATCREVATPLQFLGDGAIGHVVEPERGSHVLNLIDRFEVVRNRCAVNSIIMCCGVLIT